MAATTFQSDDSGGVAKSQRSSGHSQTISPPWTSIVKGPVVMAPDAVSSAPVSVEGQFGNFTSDYSSSAPSMAPEIVTCVDDSGTDGQASDSSGGGGGDESNEVKKPTWNKPSEGGVVMAVSLVMGTISWPALGDLSKSKSSFSESLKALADGPLPPALQVVFPKTYNHIHDRISDVAF